MFSARGEDPIIWSSSVSTSHFFHYSEMDNTYAHKMWVAEYRQHQQQQPATKHTKKDKICGGVWGWGEGGKKGESREMENR